MNKKMIILLHKQGFRRFLFMLTISFGMVLLVSAQLEISGTVKDAKTGDPLPGVNVTEKETINGTITNLDGNYSFKVGGSESILVFSYVGYDNQEIKVGDQTIVNVSMSLGLALEEVIVVGFGTQQKESVVGAITQVSGDVLLSSGTNNISTALAGKLSGVVTLQTDGKPGDEEPQIFVRGAATWNNTDPLIMVDGIERSNWSDIDPNEVESISVLKDASATAVFGAKGGNGVILITTKRGTKGKPVFNVSYSHGLKQVSDNMEMLDAFETLTSFNRGLKNDNLWGELYSEEELEHYRLQDMPYIYPSVDWVSKFFKIGHTDNANLSLRGGSENLKYFVSLGYLFDGDVMDIEKKDDFDPRNYYNRYNFRSNLDYDLTKSTTIRMNIGGSVQRRNRPISMNDNTNNLIWNAIYNSAVNASPEIYPASLLEIYPDPNEPDANEDRYPFYNNGQLFDNPWSMIYTTGFQREKQAILNTDLILEQDLSTITEGLMAKASVSYGNNVAFGRTYGSGGNDVYDARYRLTVYDDSSHVWQRFPDYHEDLEDVNFTRESQNRIIRNLYYDVSLNYKRTFADKHYVTALAVFRRKQLNQNTLEPFKEEAWSGRITYAYKLKYLFETNLGYTGSEQFAPGNRFGFFPAYAVGWNIGEESFIKDNLDFLNRLKLRYSYGKVGVDNADRWLYYQNYSEGETSGRLFTRGALGAYGAWWPYYSSYVEGPVANIIAQWETAQKQNIGIELGFFNKINLSIDLFNEVRDNILESPHTIPQITAIEFKELNLGKTKSHGYEIELSYHENFSSGFSLNLAGNFSFSENRVLFRDDPQGLPEYQMAAGFPIGQPKVTLPAGRYESVDDINNYSHQGTNVTSVGTGGYISSFFYGVGDEKYVDYNGDGVIDSNDMVAETYPNYPLYHFSMNSQISFKGFTLRALVNGQSLKTSYLDEEVSVPFASSYPVMYAHETDYYTADNPDSFYPALHVGTNNFGRTNDDNYAYGRPISSFIRLRELEISYKFDLIQNRGFRNLNIYINANNLLTYAPHINFGDPEKPSIRPGLPNSYPLVKRYNLGFKLGF